MAKKRKNNKQRNAAANSESRRQEELEIGSERTLVPLALQAKQNFLKVRSGKFRGIDILVKQNRDLLDCGFELEVDSDGVPTPESHRLLQVQVKLLLQANFKPKDDPKPDLGWGIASWAMSSDAKKAGLDPTDRFEVGFTVSRSPNKDKAARVLNLVHSTHEISGLGLEPDLDGNHLDIPAAVCLGNPGLVVVKRGQEELELTSFTKALLKQRIHEWAKPTELEKAEAAAKAAEAARAAAEAEKAAKEKAAADEAFSVFTEVKAAREAERLEQERLEREKQERELQEKLEREWSEVVNLRPDLVAAWQDLMVKVNQQVQNAGPAIRMLLGLVRPGRPSREAVMMLSSEYSEVFDLVAAWVKTTHKVRSTMSLVQCTLLFVSEAESDIKLEPLWLLLDWIKPSGDPFGKVKDLSEYTTREKWLDEVRYHPGVSKEDTDNMLELANNKISS